MIEHRYLGTVDYATTFDAMKQFTQARDQTTCDELWLLQHPPVFTQGVSGKAEHLLAPGDIPVIQIDRGGQVTYHGPGQWVVYVLLDLKRRSMGVRDLVSRLERGIIDLLAEYAVPAAADPKAPGVYVEDKKIASLGLKVSRGCSYHGLAFNADMNLEPFQRINPCGHKGLEVQSLAALIGSDQVDMAAVGKQLLTSVERALQR